jgi:Protein of unknown function (DUF1659).
MAIKKDQTSKMILKVQTGVNAAGVAAYSQRTFANIDPALSDDDFLAIAKALGSLQSQTVGSIHRQDAASILQA